MPALCLPALLVALSACKGSITRPDSDGGVPTNDGRRELGSADDAGSGEADGAAHADAHGRCGDDEAHLGGHCYRAVGMGTMTYAMAADACSVIGALPVSIHSDEENQLVYNLLYMWTACAWIGMARQSGERVWVDGTPMDYTNWQAGEPDSDDCFCIGGPTALAQNQQRWQNSRCTAQLREIVCKRKP